MSYISSSFIAPYNAGTDTSIVIVDSLGNRVAGFNVATVTKVAQEDKTILIVLESGGSSAEFVLDFLSISDANAGQILLTTAINTLYTNAIKLGVGVTIVAAPQVIVGKTLAQYITLASTNALVPLQWYNISDVGNTFGLGTNYNLQALSISDTKPFGVTPGRLSFQIDVLALAIISKQDPEKKLSSLNGGTIVSDILSTKLFAVNDSVINATNSSIIEAFGGSTLTVTNCTGITAREGANVTIEGVSNVEFVGITANIGATLSGLLSNIRIDKHTSVGAWEWPPDDVNVATAYEAYVDPAHYETQSAFVSNKVIPLKNKFQEANAMFSLKVTPGFIGAYTITLQDEALATILSVDKAYEGATIVCRWDKVALDWKLDRIDNMPVKNTALTASVDGQTTFTLPTRSVDPTKSRFYIQGQLLSYGITKDYYITNNILTYNATDYGVLTTDKLEIFYI